MDDGGMEGLLLLGVGGGGWSEGRMVLVCGVGVVVFVSCNKVFVLLEVVDGDGRCVVLLLLPTA